MLPRATENAVAGHIWPAGCYLPTPAPRASGRDGIFAKSSRCDASQQSAKLWNSWTLQCWATSRKRENPASLVRLCIQNDLRRIGEARPAGYAQGKAAPRSSD